MKKTIISPVANKISSNSQLLVTIIGPEKARVLPKLFAGCDIFKLSILWLINRYLLNYSAYFGMEVSRVKGTNS